MRPEENLLANLIQKLSLAANAIEDLIDGSLGLDVRVNDWGDAANESTPVTWNGCRVFRSVKRPRCSVCHPPAFTGHEPCFKIPPA